jgi:hypothetical protein
MKGRQPRSSNSRGKALRERHYEELETSRLARLNGRFHGLHSQIPEAMNLFLDRHGILDAD